MMDSNGFAEFVAANPWKPAKTAIKNPHEYSLREKTKDVAIFEQAVQFIRDNGYTVWFWRKPYICYDLDGRRYWTMGSPVEKTLLINRAKND